MIRSLYRDYEKAYKSKNTDFINNLNSRISQLEKENRKLSIENAKLSNKLYEIKYRKEGLHE